MGRWIFLSLFEKAFHVSDRDLKYYVSPWQALYYCGGRIPSEAGFYYGSALHVQYYQGRLIPEKVCLESLQSPFCKNMHTWCWPKVQTCFVKGSNLCKVGINEIKYSQATYRQPETRTPWLSWQTSRAKTLSFLSTQAMLHGLLEQVSSDKTPCLCTRLDQHSYH